MEGLVKCLKRGNRSARIAIIALKLSLNSKKIINRYVRSYDIVLHESYIKKKISCEQLYARMRVLVHRKCTFVQIVQEPLSKTEELAGDIRRC